MMTNRDEVARNVAKKYDVCFEAMCPKCQDALISSESERDLARETTEAYAAERDRFIKLAAENGVRAEKAEARVEELKEALEHSVFCMDRGCKICNSLAAKFIKAEATLSAKEKV